MTTSTCLRSYRIHNIVEYIKSSGDFLCDMEERGIQNILREDFDIYETFSGEEIEELNDNLKSMALKIELREAKHLYEKLKPHDEGVEFVHSNTKDIYSRQTTYRAYFSYPVDENLKSMMRIHYPLSPASQSEMRKLEQLNRLTKEQVKDNKKPGQNILQTAKIQFTSFSNAGVVAVN